ncbi:minichromosome maintenance protein 5 [Tulasnella sp. 425]|nr:minichromosome maintenance protein 5 [Tulasnella sp. 425]
MSGFDRDQVFVVPVRGVDEGPGTNMEKPSDILEQLRNFLMNFQVGQRWVYREQLRSNLLLKLSQLDVDLEHVALYNQRLADAIQRRPGEIMPLFENAATQAARTILFPLARSGLAALAAASNEDGTLPEGFEKSDIVKAAEEAVTGVQVSIKTGMNMMPFRELTADILSKLVRVPGIVISASVLSSRATRLHLQCRGCRSNKIIYPPLGLGGMGGGKDGALPRICDAPATDGQKKDCPLDPYIILHDRCTFVDQQTIKLQEAPDMVPVGELPRHMMLWADRYLTNRVIPGSRIIATGIFSTFQAAKTKGSAANMPNLRTPYLRVLHIEDTGVGPGGTSPFGVRFSAKEEEEFQELSRSENLYERFAASVAPSIYGSVDIKKAITCLLFGGSKKILPDGARLRGDINVLLLGDPGTAKSQLLKFVQKVAPIAVYTSGKGSSAAGLTASVQRDPVSREFFLEGGAMVLADGGVVCIDEFDKMRDEDRVAIHEAMEQQTISIAKAGITTVLNSRTSVLAAANPVFGRYDAERSPGENIDFQTTILSRFDMIFIIRDEHDEARDMTMAKHVMRVHMNRQDDNAEIEGEIDIEKMKRYIAYCKSKCAPRLSEEAMETLSSHFVSLRKEVQQVERDNDERSSIPMTVRQLEALIRISESLAKVTLSPTVQHHHVDEAIRLFKFSTMDAVTTGSNVEGLTRSQLREEMEKVEKEIRRRLPIGWSTSYQSLVKEFVRGQGYSMHALERTLFVLEKSDVIQFANQKKVVRRVGV